MSFGKIKKLMPMRPCEYCWETFEPYTYNQKYCSRECAKKEIGRRERIKRKKAFVDGTGGTYLKMRFIVFRRDNFTCQYCGRTVQDGTVLHIDHIQPKTKDGKLTVDNLITSCFECNEGKRDVVLTAREQEKLKSKIKVL